MTLPTPIQAFIDTTARGDTEAFLDIFTTDATLNDWGREFTGRDGIARWNRTDNIGVQAHFDVISSVPGRDVDSHVVTLRVSSNGYNGTGPITFQLRGVHIAGVVISPN